MMLACVHVPAAWAASFSQKDLQILARAAAFMVPPLGPDAVVAIAYVQGDPASRFDAEAIAASFGDGLRAGGGWLHPRLVATNAMGGGFAVVIAAQGTDSAVVGAGARAARALCVTRNLDAVRAGVCAMGIATEPRVEILLNHAAAAAASVEFAAAFRMMIQEM